MPDWTIRQPEAEDADSLAALHIAVWKYAYRGLIEQPLLDRLDQDQRFQRWRTTIAQLNAGTLGHRLLAAFVGSEPIGIIESGPGRDEDPPSATEVLSLNVAGRWHGTGVAHALMAESLGDADAYLWVLRGNDRAIGFYRKLGFELDDTERYDDVWRCFDQRMQRPSPSA